MSTRVFFSKSPSADGHAMMPVNRANNRSRSSTIGTIPSSNIASPASIHGASDFAKLAAKIKRFSNQPLPNANEPGSRNGQPSRLGTLGSNLKSRRNSILLTASDILHLNLGRPKSSRPQPPTPIILPDIIEITAARADAELEERNRLRDMAAQAIGLQPYTDSTDSRDSWNLVNEDEDFQDVPSFISSEVPKSANQVEILTPRPRSHRGSSSSILVGNQPTPTSRVRSGSTAATTTSFAPIPPYPSTLSSLSAFRQCEGLYPKYYPHYSLRIFALSKNWKYRYFIMSSPATIVARGQSPAVSYLHVFKSAGSEETELERLEINEDSVVFVAEDEVGGKPSVIKVGGADVGAMKREYMLNEGGHTMWLLHIQDKDDAKKWITNIKQAILDQRTVRAGLIPAYPLGVHEPHGDMDVMLRIRTQGIISSTMPGNVSSNGDVSLSSRSAHSLKTPLRRPASPTSLSALRGLFISRPKSASKSASRPASIEVERDQEKESHQIPGTNLLRSSTPDSPTIQSSSVAQMNVVDDRYLDRKIFLSPNSSPWKSSLSVNGESIGHKSDVVLPLQPPPRKRWTASGLSPLNTNLDSYMIGSLGRPNSLQVSSRLINKSELEPSLIDTSYSGPELRPRVSSLQSTSTFASIDRRVSSEMSNSSAKRSSTHRWSKQSLTPSSMSPRSDPLPPVPMQRANSPPIFSNRTSEESYRSATSSGKYSLNVRRRDSVPPPRPAPTSALPPAPTDPDQDGLDHDLSKPLDTSPNAQKTMYRANSAHRSSRHSLVAPKPPPNTSLPPRPDDPDYKPSHRRSSSESKYPITLETIPGSPLQANQVHLQGYLPPLPPPSLPLPIPPVGQLNSSNRVTSLKQRLRMLSTGSVGGAVPATRRLLPTQRLSMDSHSSPSRFSPPSTPIAEKIMPIQDDSFLHMYTPISSNARFKESQSSMQDSAVTSLSPPPRRRAKQMTELESPSDLIEGQPSTIGDVTHFLESPSLSPRSQNTGLLPESSRSATAGDDWILAEDSSGTEKQDSEHHLSLSRPGSIIFLPLGI